MGERAVTRVAISKRIGPRARSLFAMRRNLSRSCIRTSTVLAPAFAGVCGLGFVGVTGFNTEMVEVLGWDLLMRRPARREAWVFNFFSLEVFA